jgi:hypothetical protein
MVLIDDSCIWSLAVLISIVLLLLCLIGLPCPPLAYRVGGIGFYGWDAVFGIQLSGHAVGFVPPLLLDMGTVF